MVRPLCSMVMSLPTDKEVPGAMDFLSSGELHHGMN